MSLKSFGQADDRLLSCEQLAIICGVTARTIMRWVDDGTIPRPFKLGKANRWRASSIESLLTKLAG